LALWTFQAFDSDDNLFEESPEVIDPREDSQPHGDP
jgi:hypothetical protein